jgi:hypothetical protein
MAEKTIIGKENMPCVICVMQLTWTHHWWWGLEFNNIALMVDEWRVTEETARGCKLESSGFVVLLPIRWRITGYIHAWWWRRNWGCKVQYSELRRAAEYEE